MIADESSTANLRWAGNTLTTNGVAASRSLTVISVDRRADGTAGVGMVARSGVTPGQVEDLVREAEKAAAEASAAEDAADLVTGETSYRSESSAWSATPSATDFGVFRSFSAQLGETLRGRRGGRAEALRVRRARGDLDLRRHLGGGAGALRPANRAARAEREVR